MQMGSFIIGPASAIKIQKPHIVLYENNKPIVTIIAKEAVVGRAVKKGREPSATIDKMDFIDGAGFKTNENDILEADRITLDTKNKSIKAAGNCLLIRQGEEFKADKVTSDLMLKDFKIEKNRRRV
jgi:lipopolysaccharide export system protein LptA